ncbi:peptide deformylase [Patescibacteria group bacterium]|nr:peptide deformylase [Patescibacteria group bacterium]
MLKIVKYPAAILKKQAKEVQKVTPNLLSLISQMEVAMEKNQGIGLAAPQVGVSKQIIVLKDEKKSQAFLNPKLRSKSKKQETDEEGCLSLPGLFLPIKRAQSVRLSCNTKEGKSVIIKAAGLASRIFQHEIDHLHGKLIIDRVPPLKRWKIRKKLEEIKKKGRVNAK